MEEWPLCVEVVVAVVEERMKVEEGVDHKTCDSFSAVGQFTICNKEILQ